VHVNYVMIFLLMFTKESRFSKTDVIRCIETSKVNQKTHATRHRTTTNKLGPEIPTSSSFYIQWAEVLLLKLLTITV